MSKLKEIFHQLKGEGYHGTFEGFMKRVENQTPIWFIDNNGIQTRIRVTK